jgi:23S rRNA (uridine2552-2'-O)-methyltransferase
MKSGRSGSGSRVAGGQRSKVKLTSAKRRTASSQRWLERQLNDPFVAAAQKEGYRSRAAYKLMQMDDRYHLLKPGQRVVDLGAAPGGWSQVAATRVKSIEPGLRQGQVVAIDLTDVEALPGVEFIHLDFMDDTAPDRLKALLRDGGADVVLSDMAAPATGHTRTDHLRIMGLAEAAAAFACEVLSPGGTFLAKVLRGGTERELLDLLKRDFATVRHVKPPASRADSAELYVLAMGFRGRSD